MGMAAWAVGLASCPEHVPRVSDGIVLVLASHSCHSCSHSYMASSIKVSTGMSS